MPNLPPSFSENAGGPNDAPLTFRGLLFALPPSLVLWVAVVVAVVLW